MAADILAGPGKRLQCRETLAPRSSVSSLVYAALHTPGQPLNPAIRAFFESHFQRDFSRVRVHIDECAAASAYEMSTAAYTVGNDIVFGEGQYAPWTIDGITLLAHELTHVAQQGQRVPVPLKSLLVATPGDDLEREADECARAILARAVVSLPELRVVCRTDGAVLQGWYIDQQAPAGIHGQTHQLITRTVLNETNFAGWFHPDCKDSLIRGSADSDLEKADAERRLGRLGAAAMYHAWGASEGVYRRNIAAFVAAAANGLNAKSQDADRRRLSTQEDRAYLGRCLRDKLGKALHATQDKAAHQTACVVGSRECKPPEMDDPRHNSTGWANAFEYTRLVLREFHRQLSESSKRWVKDGPQSGGPTMLPPRDHRRP